VLWSFWRITTARIPSLSSMHLAAGAEFYRLEALRLRKLVSEDTGTSVIVPTLMISISPAAISSYSFDRRSDDRLRGLGRRTAACALPGRNSSVGGRRCELSSETKLCSISCGALLRRIWRHPVACRSVISSTGSSPVPPQRRGWPCRSRAARECPRAVELGRGGHDRGEAVG